MRLPFSKKGPKTNAQSDENLSSEFILGAIEDGVIMVGADNIVHLFNQAASKTTGWPIDEALGLDHRSVLEFTDPHGKPLEEGDDPFDKVLLSKKTHKDNKIMLRTRNNRLVPISLIVSPIPNEAGTKNVVGVFRDITEEKAEEAQRSEFISTASHEMRTPIAAIEGYLALALNPKVSQVDDHARLYLEKAHGATRHLSELFQDLLTSSKADDGRISSVPEVVELGDAIQQVVDTARFVTQKKGLQLSYLVSGNQAQASHKSIRPLFYVNVDPDRIKEVLQNLIDNAIKYTLRGSVTVALTGDETIVQIQVRDTGQGISPDDMPHLFQKFYRVDNSLTRSVGGTGLGLYICRKILELYSGQIWVESQLGQGSTFFINLPRLGTDQATELKRRQAFTEEPDEQHKPPASVKSMLQ